MTTKKWYGIEDLEKRLGPVTLGMVISSFRECDEISQTAYAKKLKISRAHLCDIEKGRRLVSPARAAKFAKILEYPESLMVQYCLQGHLRASKLNYKIELISA